PRDARGRRTSCCRRRWRAAPRTQGTPGCAPLPSDGSAMTDVERTVAELTRRVQALEDQLAIQNRIVRYGLAADPGGAHGAAAVFADDGVYDVDVGRMEGRSAVRALIDGERHRAMVGRCAHQMGPFVISLDGDRAVATGYSRLSSYARS